MQLYSVLSYLFPKIIWGPQSTDCLIMDGNIKVWNTAKLGPQPTQAQLEAAWPAAQLQSLQAAQNALNYASYLQAIQGPVSYTSKGGITTQYQADPGSVANLQSTILGFQLTQATPSGFYWVALDNTQVPFEYADLLGLAQAMALPGAAAFAKWQSLKAQVAAADLSTVSSIVW